MTSRVRAGRFICECCGANLTKFDEFAKYIIEEEHRIRQYYNKEIESASSREQEIFEERGWSESARNKAIAAYRELHDSTKWPNTVKVLAESNLLDP